MEVVEVVDGLAAQVEEGAEEVLKLYQLYFSQEVIR